MTNPVANDNFPTHQAVKERKVDARAPEQAPNGATEKSAARTTTARDDSADVSRASQRLAQEAGSSRDTAIASREQARARLAQLQLSIAQDPAAVLKAFGQMNGNTFEAAIAEPTA